MFVHIVSAAALKKAHTSTREERAEGSAASALYEWDYNATSSPPFFHQWKQAITPYPFTFLMGFSAMLLSVVMEHPLVKIHLASFVTIAANHNGEGWGGGQFPITVLLENLPEFSTLHSFSSWFDVIVGRQQLIFNM